EAGGAGDPIGGGGGRPPAVGAWVAAGGLGGLAVERRPRGPGRSPGAVVLRYGAEVRQIAALGERPGDVVVGRPGLAPSAEAVGRTDVGEDRSGPDVAGRGADVLRLR